jgi:hypothetical protein
MMKQKTLLLIATLLMATPRIASAKIIPPTLPQLVFVSDLIVRVRIVSIINVDEKFPIGFMFHRLANAEVIQVVKGSPKRREIKIAFAPSRGDSVGYASGEDCLIFASQMDNGQYFTNGGERGKHLIVSGKVSCWTNTGAPVPLQKVIGQIKAISNRHHP